MHEGKAVPKSARERGRIAPVKFAHIVLRSPQIDAMVDWYKTVLEAEVVFGDKMAVFLNYDDEHHRIGITNMPGVPAPTAMMAGVEHFAFTYETADDLFATYERLRDLGICPYWCINHGPTLSMYYRDPDLNQVELQIDVFDSIERINAWFEQSDFEVNPIGVKFDPEDLIRRYRNGEALGTLLDRPRIDRSELAAQFPAPPDYGPAATGATAARVPVPKPGKAEAAGVWNIVAKSPMGERAFTLTLAVDGNDLNGRIEGEMHDQAIESGHIKGDRLTWKMPVTEPMPMTLAFEAGVVDEFMEGRVKFGNLGEGSFSGTRAS